MKYYFNFEAAVGLLSGERQALRGLERVTRNSFGFCTYMFMLLKAVCYEHLQKHGTESWRSKDNL
jgi:hypothetical protein